MSITAKDFLDSAVQLAATGTEVCTRNCISRAYYAAFHLSISTWQQVDDPSDTRKMGMHKRYISQLQKAPANSPQKKAAVKLATLHARRLRADYELAQDFTLPEAIQQITTTKELFDLISAI